MATTVTNLTTATTTTSAASFTTASFTPTANAWIVAFFQAWLTGSGTIALGISDSESLAWSKASGRGGESSVDTTLDGFDAQCAVWTAKAGSSPPSMTIDLDAHASVTAEGGWQIVELTGDVDGTTPFEECLASIVGNAGTNAGSGISETTDTLAASPSNRVLAGFGFQHNWVAAGTAWDTPPTDWSAVSGTTVDDTDQWWLQELITTTTAKTSATHGVTGNTTVYNRGMYIAEVKETPAAPGGIVVPGLAVARHHLLTR